MGLSGNLAHFDIAEIIQLIGRNKKTGILVVSGARNNVSIYFKKGLAVFACPAHQRDYLGNMLIRRGVVSYEDVEKALAAQRKLRRRGHNVRIGSILAAKGAISRDTLKQFVRLQIEETVIAVLTEKTGSFEFVSEMDLDDADILVAVDPEWVILESSRQMDEWSNLGEEAPPPDAVFVINPDPGKTSALQLDIDDWHIVSLVNGIRTAEEIVNRAATSRVYAVRTLSRLYKNKILIRKRAETSKTNNWDKVAVTYSPPPPPEKGLLTRIINRIRGL